MNDGPTLTCHLLDTGHTTAAEHHLLRGGRRTRIAVHCLIALFQHPKHGWWLWDAGYSPRMLEATRRFPYRLYRWITPLYLRPELAAVNQLVRFGLEPRDIRRIVLSHFHADHMSGLHDFPHAEIVASQAGYASVANRSGLGALLRAYLPQLLPTDFERRAILLGDLEGPELAALGPTHDLFGDGSAILVSLPGHARGQFGLLARTDRGMLFFLADSVWLTEGVRTNTPPSRLVHLILDDTRAMQTTLGHLHHFAREHPEIQLIPSHCPEAFSRYIGAEDRA